VVLALMPIVYGIALATRTASVPGKYGRSLGTTSTTALGFPAIALGVFIHAHCFWGADARWGRYASLVETAAIVGIIVAVASALLF
jgi:hypothetical protein